MRFTETPLRGAVLIETEPREDERGFFARTACVDEFAAHGLNGHFVQQSLSWNPHTGTLRGLHFQASPYEENKLVRVTRGAIFDVIVDLRRDSDSFAQTWSVELSAERRNALYVPKGFAHGFQSMVADTEVFYEMTERFHSDAARGIRWNDADLAVDWPFPVDVQDRRRISLADTLLPNLTDRP